MRRLLATLPALLSGALLQCGEVKRECFRGGCSGELCTDRRDAVSACIWRDAYACYPSAACERQPDGQCGWTMSEELRRCLDSHP